MDTPSNVILIEKEVVCNWGTSIPLEKSIELENIINDIDLERSTSFEFRKSKTLCDCLDDCNDLSTIVSNLNEVNEDLTNEEITTVLRSSVTSSFNKSNKSKKINMTGRVLVSDSTITSNKRSQTFSAKIERVSCVFK
jgi:hypothetical protein